MKPTTSFTVSDTGSQGEQNERGQTPSVVTNRTVLNNDWTGRWAIVEPSTVAIRSSARPSDRSSGRSHRTHSRRARTWARIYATPCTAPGSVHTCSCRSVAEIVAGLTFVTSGGAFRVLL